MPRYDDQPEYNRAREPIRRDEGRNVRRAIDPSDRRPVVDRDYHIDDPMDMRMDTRAEPRTANTGTRVERPVRGIDPRAEQTLYRDPRTGEFYRDVPGRRIPYENEFDDMQPSSRPIIVSAAEPGQPKSLHAEYFLPGEGIEREVIQAEICRYLGQDAVCKPGKNPQDGRPGYLIRAYRALTTEMIRSLQDSSAKFRNEEKYWADKERRRRRPDVSYTPIQDHQYDTPMDMDDDDHRPYIPQDRFSRDPDPRDPRTLGARQYTPVTSGYLQEPGYPAYSIASAPPSAPPMGFEPRTFSNTGNTTPPTALRTAGFPASEFPPRTHQQAAAIQPQSYQDPRTGKMVGGTYSSYSNDRQSRR